MSRTDSQAPCVLAIHPFDEAIGLSINGEDSFVGCTNPAYWNMVGPYGGITAATILNALLQHPRRLGDPVTLTVNFAGPVREGTFRIRTRLIRSGRSVQHWSVELLQEHDAPGTALTTASAVFGIRRETWGETVCEAPVLPAPQDVPQSIRPRSIRWLERYARRAIDKADSPIGTAWLSDEPCRAIDFPALAAYCDAFTPWLFVRRGRRTPIGTVSLSIHFHLSSHELASLKPPIAKARYRTNVIHQGFFDQEGELWSAEDHLFATARQMVWFKE
jgi:acyl-coenzyme A thioesterase PaaI-like protein